MPFVLRHSTSSEIGGWGSRPTPSSGNVCGNITEGVRSMCDGEHKKWRV
jgi:hypothetical protein